uniref:Uncharacterized protein n=1 Tax=Ciona savignyi TaxID=51511 RepID=H2ZMZ0_CIOSA
MDFEACQFKVDGYRRPSFHNLHLSADKVKWCTRFGRCDSPLVVAISEQPNTFSGGSCIFVVLHLGSHPNEANVVLSEHQFSIVLNCSDNFLHHYNFSLDQEYSVTPIKPFPLEKVVLSTKSEDIFNWTQQNEFETGLLVASTCNKSMLVRCGDVFLAPPLAAFGTDTSYTLERFNELRAVYCEPAQQGVITVSTSIVVVRSEETNAKQVKEDRSHLKLQIIDDTNLFNLIGEQIGSTILCSESVASELNICDEKYVSVLLTSTAMGSEQLV